MIKWTMSCLLLISTSAFSSQGKDFVYGENKFEGYIVLPKGAEKADKKFPALLMIHNWMGVSAEVKKQADRFADLGYVVFAGDIYGKGVRPKDGAEAGKLAGTYKGNRSLFRERLNLALSILKNHEKVEAGQLAALGYCFGGTGVIELARSGAELKSVISFHGGLDSPNPSDGKNIKAQVIAHHGAIDPFVKAEDLAAFEKEMKDHSVKYQVISYEGAVHSFTDQGAGGDIKKGAAYDKKADTQSFAWTKAHLKEIFGK